MRRLLRRQEIAGGNMAYSRTAALDYAEKHWNSTCHDGVISIIGSDSISVEQKWRELRLPGNRNDWVFEWVRDYPGDPRVAPESAAFRNRADRSLTVFQFWSGLGDCAHFMSNTLTAGGIQGLKTDYVPYL